MKTLREFLIEKKALDTFCTNVLVRNKNNFFGNTPQQVEKLIDTLCTHCAIISSVFIWRNTPQGIDYWYELSKEWDKYLIDNNSEDVITGDSFSLIK